MLHAIPAPPRPRSADRTHWLANELQQQIIELQNDQVKALLKILGKNRVLLTDDQRRVLAVTGHALGRKAVLELTTIATPDTILRRHRQLVVKKWDHSNKRKAVGRPRIRQVIVESILRFAPPENPTWGYDRIQRALANIGYHIADCCQLHGGQRAESSRYRPRTRSAALWFMKDVPED